MSSKKYRFTFFMNRELTYDEVNELEELLSDQLRLLFGEELGEHQLTEIEAPNLDWRPRDDDDDDDVYLPN